MMADFYILWQIYHFHPFLNRSISRSIPPFTEIHDAPHLYFSCFAPHASMREIMIRMPSGVNKKTLLKVIIVVPPSLNVVSPLW
jgi:hypothetical protein